MDERVDNSKIKLSPSQQAKSCELRIKFGRPLFFPSPWPSQHLFPRRLYLRPFALCFDSDTNLPLIYSNFQGSMARIMLPFRALFIVCLCLFFYSLCASATLVNVTVDDSSSDITYSPANEWSQGDSCSECTAHPDIAETNDGTWHDTTFKADGSEPNPQTASLQFNGKLSPNLLYLTLTSFAFTVRIGCLRVLYPLQLPGKPER